MGVDHMMGGAMILIGAFAFYWVLFGGDYEDR